MLSIKKLDPFQKTVILLFVSVGLYFIVKHSLHFYEAPHELTVDDWIEALDHKSGKARYDATLNLGRSQDPKAARALIERLKSDEIPESDIYSITQSLGKLKSKEAVKPLIELLGDGYFLDYEEYHIKRMAVLALGEIGDKEALSVLKEIDKKLIPKTDDEREIKQSLKEAIAKLENSK